MRAQQVQTKEPSAQPAAVAPVGTQATQPGPKAVEEGLFPKSFKIPGTDLSVGIGGYVKVDFIQDFSGIGDAYEFKTNSIPVDGTSAAGQSGRTTIHARETRFNLDLRSNGTGGRHFRAFVEGDFFGDNNSFRLRHGYGEFGSLLGGQTWSTFQDISARGLTIDFEGPDGEVFRGLRHSRSASSELAHARDRRRRQHHGGHNRYVGSLTTPPCTEGVQGWS